MNREKKYLKFMIILYPSLDIIYTINEKVLNINIPVNQFLRVVILLTLLFLIKNIKKYIYIFCVFLILISSELYHIMLNQVPNLLEDISFLTKIMLFVTFFFYFSQAMKRQIVTSIELMKWIVFSSFIITTSVILSKFGIGFSSWETGARSGVKGLFAVQNTITATLLIILPISLYLYFTIKEKKFIASSIMIVSSLLLIGTKSGLGGAIIIILLIGLHAALLQKNTYFKVISLSLIVSFLFSISKFLYEYVVNFINEQLYIYNSYGYSNIFSFLVSNRDLQISYLDRYLYFNEPNQYWYLFGMGYSKANIILKLNKKEFDVIEMDYYGVFYYSGIVITILIMSIIMTIFLKSVMLFIKAKNSFLNYCLLLSISIAIFHSFYGGHVIYEALTSLYFSIILCMINSLYLESKLKIVNRRESNDSKTEVGFSKTPVGKSTIKDGI